MALSAGWMNSAEQVVEPFNGRRLGGCLPRPGQRVLTGALVLGETLAESAGTKVAV